VGLTTDEYRRQREAIVAIGVANQRNLRLERDRQFLSSGGSILAGQDITLNREAIASIQQAEQRGTAALASLAAGSNNQFVDATLQRSDRGYVLQLAELMERGGFQGMRQAQELGNLFDAGKIDQGQLSEKLDQLLAGIERLSNSPRSLTVQTPDPVRDAIGIANDISNQRMGALGL
jgi:flagellar biosynthesis/type III secretory pathway protein FliH